MAQTRASEATAVSQGRDLSGISVTCGRQERHPLAIRNESAAAAARAAAIRVTESTTPDEAATSGGQATEPKTWVQ
ncbi:hypothetical protein GCM10027290_60220 [Micromonospora sonneratiae]